MTEKYQLICDLIDDELPEDARPQAIKALLADKNLQQLWAAAYIGKELLNNPRTHVPSASFAAKVSSAIAKEPPILARISTPVAVAAPPSKTRKNNVIQLILKPVAGVAVAAGVAAGVVVVSDNIGSSQPQVIASSPVAAPARAGVVNPAAIKTVDWQGSPAVSQELNNMLINHAQFANTGSYQSLVPYARIVSHEQQ